jgi:hypothetical protein
MKKSAMQRTGVSTFEVMQTLGQEYFGLFDQEEVRELSRDGVGAVGRDPDT